MSAYVIVDIEVKDPVRYEDYKNLASSSIAAHYGRYIVRGGPSEVLHGEWRPRRLVILEFASVEAARRWECSAEYSEAKKIRNEAAVANMVVVEGL